MIQTGFADQFWASHRMGPAQILLKMILLSTPLLSHWSMPLKGSYLTFTKKILLTKMRVLTYASFSNS
jgi:hypothetical protein